MKRGIIFLILLLLINISLAQNLTEEVSKDKLIVRFHSVGKEAEINLRKHLGISKEYYSRHTENVTVEINKLTGKAKITGNPGWVGVETIEFTLVRQGIITPIIRIPESQIKELSEISDEELQSLFSNVVNKTFTKIIEITEVQQIEKILVSVKDRNLNIIVNDAVELNLAKENNKPKVKINLLIENKGPPDIFKISTGPFKIAGTLILLIIIAFIFRDPIKNFVLEEVEEKTRNDELIKRLIKVESYGGKKQEKELKKFLNSIFRDYNLNQKSSLLNFNKAMSRNNILGLKKQQIYSLFKNYKNFEGTNKKMIIRKIKSLVKHL